MSLESTRHLIGPDRGIATNVIALTDMMVDVNTPEDVLFCEHVPGGSEGEGGLKSGWCPDEQDMSTEWAVQSDGAKSLACQS